MTDKNFLEPQFLLFARRLANTPPFPADADGIRFNFALQRWELAPFGGGGEANTSSNVGVGLGWALPKVGVDLPFKSFIAIAPLSVVSNPTDITISIAQQLNTFILGTFSDDSLPTGNSFIGVFSDDETTTEADTQGFLAFAYTVVRYTLRINGNSRNMTTTFSFRDGGVDVPNTPITVLAGVTGSFDSGVISEIISANALTNFAHLSGGGAGAISDFGQYLECEK